MDIQFIDITSFRGISSDAEHFYAKIGKVKNSQEYLLTMPVMTDICDGVSFTNEPHLRYYPDEREARRLWEKDNGHTRQDLIVIRKEKAIAELQEDGTIRFPSILSIVKRARELFPDSLLVFSFCKSRKQFVKLLSRHDEKTIMEILKTAGVIS